MAEEQKPVEVAETTPVVAEPATETKPVEDKPVETTPVAEAAATEAPAEATETTEAAAPAEEAKEEVKPIEAGTLEHKGAPANFPKNLIYSKQHFWFGTDAIPKDKLATYLKNEKATEVAHHVTAWAAETGKGLFFYGKESDKSTPTGAIQLAEASEPTAEGATKFSFTAKGHKHAFKAPTAADRDNWVEQLKLKIAEAKELAATIAETEAYKQTLESLKPAKEEKPAEAEPAKEEAKEEPKEEDKKEEPKEEDKKEDGKDSKRRSASRKRASIFGNLLGKKEEAKKETPAEDKSAEDKPAETAEAAEPIPEDAAAATETPAVETPAAEEAKKEEPVKPTPTKRASLFGGLSFGKKKVESESAPATPAKDAPVDASVAETAPVIPAVETSEPLSTEVASPTTIPETTDAAPATNGETKEKTEKRKSSLPFGFGKKEKTATSDEEGEKVKSPPFFSKLRQTVKGKGKAEKPIEESKAEDAKPADVAEETEPAKEAEAEPAVAPIAEETSAEKPAAAAPAPVTAAA
ncbi:Pleckstrin homology domain-containing protein [Daldinia decipiens]|uniref:Pleckstrin homology domain-containing protein n=1 Tax=Daldinia decipiens TaxID=326647 RepID=UPI0020C1D21F|nr:Pleckstrin homology domain-containing protein [Daldinia decipiens]KAI1656906.1 Pleckstrin homology domain-containing protein [Daldinia decipiens]